MKVLETSGITKSYTLDGLEVTALSHARPRRPEGRDGGHHRARRAPASRRSCTSSACWTSRRPGRVILEGQDTADSQPERL